MARWYAFQSWIWLLSWYKLSLAGTLILRRTIHRCRLRHPSRSCHYVRRVSAFDRRQLGARSIKVRRRYPCLTLNDIAIATVFYKFPLKSPPGKNNGWWLCKKRKKKKKTESIGETPRSKMTLAMLWNLFVLLLPPRVPANVQLIFASRFFKKKRFYSIYVPSLFFSSSCLDVYLQVFSETPTIMFRNCWSKVIPGIR